MMAKAKAKRARKRSTRPGKAGATTPERERKAKPKAEPKSKRPLGQRAKKPAGVGAGKKRKAAQAKASRKPAKPVKAVSRKPTRGVKPPRKVKRSPAKKPAPAKRPAPKPKKISKAEHARELAARRKRDRARRAEQKKATELEKKRRRWKRKRRKSSKVPAGPGVAWLRRILTHCNEVFECDLETTFPGGGVGAASDVEIHEQSKRTPWLVVGKYTPEEPIGYGQLAEAFMRVMDDLLLEADLGPQRFTQIRVLFHDPKAKFGEGDAVISKVGAWEFVWSDLVGELVGSGDADSPDEDSLAARYQQTSVPIFYVFLSESEIRYRTAFGRGKTQEIKLS